MFRLYDVSSFTSTNRFGKEQWFQVQLWYMDVEFTEFPSEGQNYSLQG